MVTQQARQTIQWLAPSPMWGEQSTWLRLPEQQILTRPTILRFANDAFVEELIAMLNHAPWRIAEWVAQPETWRDPMASPDPVVRTRPHSGAPRPYNRTRLLQGVPESSRRALFAARAMAGALSEEDVGGDAEPPIKLYQASHQRYYVVTASLISAKARYPDYAVDLTHDERATFVVRALVEPVEDGATHEWDEYAFVTTPHGPAWQKVGPYQTGDGDLANRRLVAGEEQLGLFPVTYSDVCDRQRQILGGLIPVGRREEWVGAPAAGTDVDPALAHPVPSEPAGVSHLSEIFRAAVVEPWKALVEQAEAFKVANAVDENPFPNFGDMWNPEKAEADKARAVRDARDQIQTGSWYVLLDFANFLEQHLPRIWDHINGVTVIPSLDAGEQAIVTMLRRATLSHTHYLGLAVENLAVGKASVGDGLWAELKKLWEVERFLGLDAWPDRETGLPSSAAARIGQTDAVESLFDAAEDLMDDPWYTLVDLLVYLEQATTTASRASKLRAYALDDIPDGDLSSVERRLVERIEELEVYAVGDEYRAIVGARGATRIPAFLSETLGLNGLTDRSITIKTSLLHALVAVKQHGENLEQVDTPYARVTLPDDEYRPHVIDERWPDFLFPLADPEPSFDISVTVPIPSTSDNELAGLSGFERVETAIENLAAAVDAGVANTSAAQASPEAPLDPTPLLDQRRARFVVRCVFERPWCGQLFAPAVSQPTRQFELAPFFDPDAPARPIRIQLPVDISPAGLRKFKKNTMFLISDMLCGRIKKIRKLTLADLVLSVLPWPFHKDLPRVGPTGPCLSNGQTLGMVCSLSIPIVTLCALILLFVIVSLFDKFFRWIPYLFVCFPIRLKGKQP